MHPDTGHDRFLTRHLGTRGADLAMVLEGVGAASLEDLAAQVVPTTLPVLEAPPQPERPGAEAGGLSEDAAVARLRSLAALNDPHTEMIGRGYHPTTTPAVIVRDVLSNPAWTTAYTPYQAEISQGRLEAQLLFQTVVADLTGLPVACTSLLDEATAVAEAVLLMARAHRGPDGPVLLDAGLHPQLIEVARARAEALDIPVEVVGAPTLTADGGPLTGAVLAHTTTRGLVQDLSGAVGAVHARGGLVAVDADPLALTLLTEPGAVGADVAVGTAQRLGVPLFLGGPHPGFMAVTEALRRQLPGRVVGISRDADGREAYRLALQTREQHIRRQRATSNICTAQALLAVVAAFYAVHHGPEGLRAIAGHVHHQAGRLACGARALGLDLEHEDFFDTVSVHVPGAAREAVERAEELGVNLRLLDADHVGVSTNETTTDDDVDTVLAALAAARPRTAGRVGPGDDAFPLPASLARTSPFLTHPTFHRHRSEASLVRYMRRLADRDLALDRTMIPLGSCTLKLNAAAQSALWLDPALAGIHPYAPAAQTRGWRLLLGQLADRLTRLTGYDRCSLQPASGAQGELAGLLAVRGYLRSTGQEGRDLVLVPASAHGTNAASAAGAGFTVMVVATAEDGSVDVEHLRGLLAEHGGRVAAIMLTYPSTHGVFEPRVTEVTALVHEAGGQVYIDGANLNALTGLLRPGDLGGDVSHLNLHKTFAIPHGGGGPGVGPVVVKEHLAPFLPAGPAGSPAPEPGEADHGFAGAPVMGARFGSAGVMPLAWTYLVTLTDADLRQVTLTALAHASYLSRALADSFPTLYTYRGRVAHECVLDLRPLTAATGVTAEDVAKRLIDYGFHAPTLSFPVAGTLMVEPTESEPLCELDRFVAAMRSIRAEIDEVASGAVALEESVLRRSPHTLAAVTAERWERPYSRASAAFPLEGMETDKYFPPVSRIDNAWGDRHLRCTCPAPGALEAQGS
ncbi:MULTISPECIES: aminomethyl-transferring glycine dehydrogenase [unclassified Actinomyces]|uniref:aminomethyl-transferring glycine dehydrogenase n=2 Tax=Actinomyces TaxID=1654 RepID=UPI0020173C2D|nr:aminomethyl-transferring glycine dehydrogenase [Actinomyces sp. AC-20-1]MCL3790648.1 aminomethyl-transferring glycine dehydrogenase [Actinomyces sp. 187325]MCL3792030.1 aminomethyl-transferring glycine dehydrogenase [Actinomyces sp. 186855]MCL3795381.1 aminomethyl-transferring glycine dehydrogenase [Actinomyces sp. 217892]